MQPPYRVFVVFMYVLAACNWLYQRMHPAPILAIKMVGGLASAHLIAALCELQIADALADGPKTAAELASELGACLGSVSSDCRALSSMFCEAVFSALHISAHCSLCCVMHVSNTTHCRYCRAVLGTTCWNTMTTPLITRSRC